MRGIEIRETLTNEWKRREVGGDREYAILTAEISKATFGMTPSQYKKFKNLTKKQLQKVVALQVMPEKNLREKVAKKFL